jgi:hypothetical protein
VEHALGAVHHLAQDLPTSGCFPTCGHHDKRLTSQECVDTVIGAIQHHGTDASVQGRGAAALGMLAHRGGDSLKRTHYSDVL